MPSNMFLAKIASGSKIGPRSKIGLNTCWSKIGLNTCGLQLNPAVAVKIVRIHYRVRLQRNPVVAVKMA